MRGLRPTIGRRRHLIVKKLVGNELFSRYDRRCSFASVAFVADRPNSTRVGERSLYVGRNSLRSWRGLHGVDSVTTPRVATTWSDTAVTEIDGVYSTRIDVDQQLEL